MKNYIRKCLDLNLLSIRPENCHAVMRKPEPTAQNIVIEFSSPNIAKPMHMGHFRATVVGNFVKNINLAAGNRVTAINYLGDWGTQLGMLCLGYSHFGNPHLLETDPLKHLHSVYVRACQSFGSTDDGMTDASSLSTALETGERPDLVTLWSKFRSCSIEELKRLYARMNIVFDRYEHESEFVQEASSLVKQLISQRIARREPDGSVTAASSEAGKRVTLLKSDGGTLYLTRDLAAAISRAKKFEFDRMHYVMEQSDPWAMTSDQRAYYLAQFLRLQPDPSGFLSGQTAKSFFELSKLPVSELSLIWELSDVDSDGQLTLSEFSVAMHLVVLHRNGVMLPSRLPDSLRAVATSSALSAPPPPPPVDPSSAISPPDPPDVAATSAVERRAHLGEHRSLDSACQESVRLAQPPHRRWSASSQSDAVSLAEGMTSFDGRLAPNAQVRHPIAIRANPVPVGGGAQDGAPRPPTPPPRARAKTVTSTSRPSASAVLHQSSPPQTPQFQNSSSKGTSQSQSELQNHRIQQLTAMLLPTQAECERIMRENNELTSELVGLQKRRIALEILLERLTPL